MHKVIAIVRKRPDLTRAEFLRIWQVEHPPLVWALPGVVRYVQNPSIEHREPWPYDGLGEIWFESKRAIAAAFETDEAARLRAHEAEFVDEVTWWIAEEIEIPPPARHNEADGIAVADAPTSRYGEHR